MIYAFDTYYLGNTAKTVCIGFEDWPSTEILVTESEVTQVAGEYISGEFYKRELPCILSLLKKRTLSENDVIVIDGFVVLDDNGKLGLGGHLYEAIHGQAPVVGVAKTNFATLNAAKAAVYRGESKKPLFITAMGMELASAAANITSMAGQYRMPDLLKKLDLLTKSSYG